MLHFPTTSSSISYLFLRHGLQYLVFLRAWDGALQLSPSKDEGMRADSLLSGNHGLPPSVNFLEH